MTLIKAKLHYLKSQLVYVTLPMVLLLSSVCSGQTTSTNQGSDFWFGFPGNWDVAHSSVNFSVDITAFYSTTGTLFIPGQAYSIPFTVTPPNVTRLSIPSANVGGLDNEGFAPNAVHVTAAGPIEVFYNEESGGPRNDNSYVLPDTLLGKYYYVSAYNLAGNTANSTASQFIITSPGNSVRVAITPSVNTDGGHAANVTYDTTIAPGQVYQVRATLQDLTGTEIVAVDSTNPTQKFSVSAGMDIGSIGATCANGTVDPAFEMLIPVVYWGESYIFIPTPDNAQDICRVLAADSNTNVYINGTLVQTLNPGGYYDQTVQYSAPAYVTANKPICVNRLLQTASCNGIGGGLGDPDMILVQPNEQMYLDSVTFYTSSAANTGNGMTQSWIQVVTRTADAQASDILLDGVAIPPASFTALAQGPTPNEYSYAAVSLPTPATTDAYHQLTINGGCGFLAYMEGVGSPTSIGSAAGVFLHFPTGGVASTTYAAAHCFNCDGTATVNVAGGIGPFIYSWSDGNAQTTQTATGLCAGTYTVTVQERCGVHNDIATVVVPNGAAPAISYSVSPSYTVCVGTPVTISINGGSSYQWSWSPGSTSSTQSITETPTTSTTYSATIGNGICASVSDSVRITVNPEPVVTITPDTSICLGAVSTLNVTGGCTYSWSGGGSNATSSPYFAKPTTTTAYTATVTTCEGCSETASTIVTVNTYPKVKVTQNTSICLGQTVQLVASSSGGTSPYIYSWSPSTELTCNNCSNPIAAPTGNITYTVTSTSTSNVCSTPDSVAISLVPIPVTAFYAKPDSIDVGGSINFVSLTSGSQYTWTFGDGGGATDSIISHQYTEAGEFVVWLQVANSLGCPDSVSEDVYVNPPIRVPNVFTPNGDNTNDQFVIYAEGLENYNIQIYDRWGKQVFTSGSLTSSWDGKSPSGEEEADGIYYYIIKASDFTGRAYSLNGYLQLIR